MAITSVTLGPDAVDLKNKSWYDNRENEQNTANVDSPKKSPDLPVIKSNSSTRSGITFSIKKILLENEMQRREEVRKIMEKRKQDMEKSEKAVKQKIELMRAIMIEKREKEEAAESAKLDAEEERLAQQSEIRRRHEQQLHAQRLQERKERLEKEAEELKQREELVEKIRNNFRDRCKDLGALTKACKDKNSVAHVLAPFTNKFKHLSLQMEIINEKVKRGELTNADISIAETIARQSEEVLVLSKAEIERIDAQYEEEIARREQEMKQAEAQAQAEAAHMQMLAMQAQSGQFSQGYTGLETVEPIANVGTGTTTTTDSSSVETVIEESEIYPDDQSVQSYVHAQMLLEKYTNTPDYQEFVGSSETKKFRFECQKAINIPVNTISSVNGAHLMEKYNKLRLLLEGKSSPNVNQHPQGSVFCKNLLAKNIVVSI